VAGRHVVNECILYCWAKLNLFFGRKKVQPTTGINRVNKARYKDSSNEIMKSICLQHQSVKLLFIIGSKS